MKVIVWNSQEKRVADYHKLMGGCDVLCLLDCGQWEIPQSATQIQNNLFYWKEEGVNVSYDVFYSSEKLAFLCREGLYGGESIVYKVHPVINSLVGIRLKDNFWLFANHESSAVNSYHIGEFYLREITDRFRKAAFIVDFTGKSYSWALETVGKLYCVTPPENYHPRTVNYLFTIHVACKDQFLIDGYEDSPNLPTFFDLEI